MTSDLLNQLTQIAADRLIGQQGATGLEEQLSTAPGHDSETELDRAEILALARAEILTQFPTLASGSVAQPLADYTLDWSELAPSRQVEKCHSDAFLSPPSGMGVDRFAWLFGPEIMPVPGLACTVDEVAQAANVALDSWRISGLLETRLRLWAGPLWQQCPRCQTLSDIAVAAGTLARIQQNIAQKLAAELCSAGLRFVFLKGLAFQTGLYSQVTDRCAGMDIDIGAARDDVAHLERIAGDIGFQPAQWCKMPPRYETADPSLRTAVEMGHHELGYLIRPIRISGMSARTAASIRRAITALDMKDPWYLVDGDPIPRCYISLDVHHGLNRRISVTDLLDAPGAIETVSGIGVPNRVWSTLFMIFKIYWDGVQNYRRDLYKYADLTRLVAPLDHAESQKLAAQIRHYNMGLEAHYVLRRLPQHFGMALPSPLQEVVAEYGIAPVGKTPAQCGDLGDMWPKLWGFR